MLRRLEQGLGLVFGLFVLIYAWKRPDLQGDSYVLVENARDLWSCTAAGRVPCPAAGQFPLFQLIPSVLLRATGLGADATVTFLCFLSTLSFVALLTRSWLFLSRRHRPALGWLGLWVLASGYLIVYYNSSFGEMLAAFLIAELGMACLEGRSLARAAAFFVLASMTKETAAPFLALLAWALWNGPRGIREGRALLGSLGVSLGAAAGLNLLRFGVPWNVMYLAPGTRVQDLSTRLSFWAAQWVAPGAGILFYWPSLLFLIVLGAVLKLREGRHGAFNPKRWIPEACLAALTSGFASWYAPFGAYAWGPRLLLPWLPVMALIALDWYGEKILESLGRLTSRRPALAWGAWIAGSLLSFPNSKALVWRSMINQVIERPLTGRGNLTHDEATLAQAWSLNTPWLEAFLPGPHPEQLLFSALWGWMLFWLARQVQRDNNVRP